MIADCLIAVEQRTADLPRVQIGHALVHSVGFADAVRIVVEHAASSEIPAYVVTPNAQHVALLENDPYLRHIYEGAALVVPDGASLLIAAKLLGKILDERVAGVDLFQGVCRQAAVEGLRVFLLGGRPGSAAQAASRLQAACPGLIVAGISCPPSGFENNEDRLREVAHTIRAARPHIVFVALGAPKQEYWIYEHGAKLGVPMCMGVGGAFEIVGGLTRRAPLWLQHAHLEWLFRLIVEPRRLWRRYTIGNAQFMAVVFRQLMNPNEYSKNAWAGVREH